MSTDFNEQEEPFDYRSLGLAFACLAIAPVSVYACALLGMALEVAISPKGGGPAMMGSLLPPLGLIFGGLFGGIGSVFAVLWGGSRKRNFQSRVAVATGLTIAIGLGLFEDYRARVRSKQEAIERKEAERNRKAEIDTVSRLVYPEFVRLSQMIENGKTVDYVHEIEVAKQLVPPTTVRKEWCALRGYLEPSKESSSEVQLACLELFKRWFQLDSFAEENNFAMAYRLVQINDEMIDGHSHYLISFVHDFQRSIPDEVRESGFSILLRLEAFQHGFNTSYGLEIKKPLFIKPAAEYLLSNKSYRFMRLKSQEQVCAELLQSFPDKSRVYVPGLVTKLKEITQYSDSEYFQMHGQEDGLIETIFNLGGPDALDETTIGSGHFINEKVKSKKEMMRI